MGDILSGRTRAVTRFFGGALARYRRFNPRRTTPTSHREQRTGSESRSVRDGRISAEEKKIRLGARHGVEDTWGETCITSRDSKCNVRTRNAIIMRTRPRARSRRDARRAQGVERRRGDKETRARTRTVTGRDTAPESAVAAALLRGDKYSTGKLPPVLHSRNVAPGASSQPSGA